MNPVSLIEAKKIFNKSKILAEKAKNIDLVVCPPFVYIGLLNKIKLSKNLFIGAQNVSDREKGALTGEISIPMLKDLGVKFIILGHSERRALGETNQSINKKLLKTFEDGLTPILCIGESLRDKDGDYIEFIKTQIKECLLDIPKKYLIGMIIAYEPIWAIGKSYRESMTATDIHETTLVIKKIVSEHFGRDIANSLKILYGGSVEPENAGSIIQNGNVDGFLVGHASLVPEDFNKIIQIVK